MAWLCEWGSTEGGRPSPETAVQGEGTLPIPVAGRGHDSAATQLDGGKEGGVAWLQSGRVGGGLWPSSNLPRRA